MLSYLPLLYLEVTMSKRCQVCGKGPVAGRTIKRRGLAKKKGGVGRKVTGITARVFYPNLKKVKAKVGNSVKTIKACVKCIKTGRVKKAS